MLIEHVAKYRLARERTLVLLERIAANLDQHADDPRAALLQLTVRSGIHAARAAVAWCDEALATLHTLADRQRSVGMQPANAPTTT